MDEYKRVTDIMVERQAVQRGLKNSSPKSMLLKRKAPHPNNILFTQPRSIRLHDNSGPTPPVLQAPVNFVPPEIIGALLEGEVLEVYVGEWVANPPASFTYQWLKDMVPMVGITGSTYTVTADDLEHDIRVVVTGANSLGSSFAVSNAARVGNEYILKEAGASVWLGNPPWTAVEADTGLYTLGTVIQPVKPGAIIGVRYYRTGSESTYFDAGRSAGLYSPGGALLASGASLASEEVGSGWREIIFTTPFIATVGIQYILAVQAQTYPVVVGYFGVGGEGASGVVSADGSVKALQGRYIEGGSLAYPSTTSTSSYFVDIIYQESAPAGTGIWYVDPVAGHDTTGNGSASNPYQSFEKAQEVAAPGDRVKLGDGAYGKIQITKSLKVEAINRHGPKINTLGAGSPPATDYGVQILAPWVTVDGLEVTTGGHGVAWQSHGIMFDDQHHTKVINCKVRDCPGSGITGQHVDYVHVAGNECYNCALDGWFSGITLYQAEDITGRDDFDWLREYGTRILIENNILHDNKTLPGSVTPDTDGNALLVDDFNHTQSRSQPWTGIPYTKGYVVHQNIAYNNGRRGFGGAWSNYGLFINNTSYRNWRDVKGDPFNSGLPYTVAPELSNQSCAYTVFVNNIAIADSNGTGSTANNVGGGEYAQSADPGFNTNGAQWLANAFFDVNKPTEQSFRATGVGTSGPLPGSGTIWTDPKLVNPTSGEFSLQVTSPCLDAGILSFGISDTDYAGDPRLVGNSVDMGAFEGVKDTGPPPIVIPDFTTGLTISGGTRYQGTDYDYYVSTGVGNITVNGSGAVEAMLLGGGGAGPTYTGNGAPFGGGGGGGGVVYNGQLYLSSVGSPHSREVGAGGVSNALNADLPGGNGGPTRFLGLLAVGGGGGGVNATTGTVFPGQPGASSGGGGGGVGGSASGPAGAAIPAQGFTGGAAFLSGTASLRAGGGGGGANAAGAAATASVAGNGGVGIPLASLFPQDWAAAVAGASLLNGATVASGGGGGRNAASGAGVGGTGAGNGGGSATLAGAATSYGSGGGGAGTNTAGFELGGNGKGGLLVLTVPKIGANTKVRLWLSDDVYRDDDGNPSAILTAALAAEAEAANAKLSVSAYVFGDCKVGGQWFLTHPGGVLSAMPSGYNDGDTRYITNTGNDAANKVAAGNLWFHDVHSAPVVQALTSNSLIFFVCGRPSGTTAVHEWDFTGGAGISPAAVALAADITAAISNSTEREIVVYSAGGGANVAAEAIARLLANGVSAVNIMKCFMIVQHGRNNWNTGYDIRGGVDARNITRPYTLGITNQNDPTFANGWAGADLASGFGPNLATLVHPNAAAQTAIRVATGVTAPTGVTANATFSATNDFSDAGSHAFCMNPGRLAVNWDRRLTATENLFGATDDNYLIANSAGAERTRVLWHGFRRYHALALFNPAPVVPGTPGGPGDPDPNDPDIPEPTIYVSKTGNNSNSGTKTSPLLTIAKAVEKSTTAAGDVIGIGDGVWEETVQPKTGTQVVSINPRGAIIDGKGVRNYGFLLQNKDHINIQGLVIRNHKMAGIDAGRCHHLGIFYNHVYNNVGNGISLRVGEFYTVEGNDVHDNAQNDARSGISILSCENITGDTTTAGFRVIVRKNRSYNNITLTGSHADGDGIIMDRNLRTSDDRPETVGADYLFPMLVEDNVVYGNGGAGIRNTWVRNTTNRHNTSYGNSQDKLAPGTWKGELHNTRSWDNTWDNNVGVSTVGAGINGFPSSSAAFANDAGAADPGKNLTSARGNIFFAIRGNLIDSSNGGAVPSSTLNQFNVDPQFENAAGGDFRLKSTSPGINAATDGGNVGCRGNGFPLVPRTP